MPTHKKCRKLYHNLAKLRSICFHLFFFWLCIFFTRVSLDITKYGFFRICSEIHPPTPTTSTSPSPSHPHTPILFFHHQLLFFVFPDVELLHCRHFTLSTFYIVHIFLSTIFRRHFTVDVWLLSHIILYGELLYVGIFKIKW